jgi:hypothetical protein
VLIPKGYEGWVVIRYLMPDAPALEKEDGRVLIRIPATGTLSTSSDLADGYAVDEYWFLDSDGGREKITDGTSCTGTEPCIHGKVYFSQPIRATRFFVGKKDNLAKYSEPEIK